MSRDLFTRLKIIVDRAIAPLTIGKHQWLFSRDFQSQNREITQSTMLLLIRNHPLHFAEIAIAHQCGRS
jgi:hypothetical protein